MTILSELTEDERYALFDRLQLRMATYWQTLGLNIEDECVVVIPSVTVDRVGARSGSLTQAYEERLLFLLLLLRQSRLQMIYVTSMPIPDDIVEYYLALLPGVIPSHAMARLTLVSVDDSSARPLSEKLLERPRLLRRVAAMIPDRTRSHLIPYNTTELERDIALALGIPMFGADPRLFELGTKTGCRRLFAEEDVPHPRGVEGLASVDEVVDAIVAMRAGGRRLDQVIVKLNEGVSGEGNALVDLRGVSNPGDPDERGEIRARVEGMTFERADTPFQDYVAKLLSRGGVVEELIEGHEVRSPSVQLRITPDGHVELLSTHDQLLGGPSGQSYLGCVFPADAAYSRDISAHAAVIGSRLAKEGVIGRFAIDFVVVRTSAGAWIPYAIEINLRKGGTTHPFLTLQFLTNGRYDADSGCFLTPEGHQKCLIATDHLESADLRSLSRADLFDLVARERVHFDQVSQRGVVFHMISSLSEHGLVGLTAVGNSPEQARAEYRRAEELLRGEAMSAKAALTVDTAHVRG